MGLVRDSKGTVATSDRPHSGGEGGYTELVRGGIWVALPHALERFLLRRLRCRNAADVAQESVVRWLQKFQADTARWPDIYRWCLRTARRIVIDEWRHARIERVAPEAVC